MRGHERTMSNATWACFDCREAVRRPTQHADAVPCPRCGNPCRGLGTKVRVPTKDDERAWQDLRVRVREERLANAERAALMRVRLRHGLEQQIAEVEARSSNEARYRTIHFLRKQLALL